MSPNRFRGSADGTADQPDDASSGPLSRPSRLLQASPEQLGALTEQPEASRRSLQAVARDSRASPQDRVAAAVLLEAVLDDPGAASSVDSEDAESPEALRLRFSSQLRPSAARILGTPATMRLLTWAAESTPGDPPVEAAEAAAHLGVDDDGRIYGRVSQRAVQIADQRGLSRSMKERLRSLTDALGTADHQARRQRTERDSAGSAPAADQGPVADRTAEAPQPEPGAGTGSDDTHPAVAAEHGDQPPASWTSADDAALASMLGHGAGSPQDERGQDERAREEGARDEPSPDGPSSLDPDDETHGSSPAGSGAGLSPESPPDDSPAPGSGQSDGQASAAPEAPGFGRPVGFDGGDAGSGRASDDDIDDRPGTGPGYGSTGTTGAEPPRSYDFRYLGDETKSPSTEAEKAEFRTTLRNWGLFALFIVFALIIVAIII